MSTTLRNGIALLFAAVLSCSDVEAAGNNGKRYISDIGVHDTGHVIVRFTAPGAQVEACTSPSFQSHVILHRDDPRFKSIYALLLSAFHNNTLVEGWVSGCVDLWDNGAQMFPRVLTMGLMR
jgi:hypothetical protein